MPAGVRACTWLSSISGSISEFLPPPEHAGRGHAVSFLLLIASGLIGWCPTPAPKPTPTPKDPLAGIIGGIAGAYLVYYALGFEGTLSSPDFIALAIGAFATGKVLQQLTNWVLPSPAGS